MSAKYQRIKQTDLALPAPLRWLTRAFSSITLAIILLSCVVIYGTIASVPVLFLLMGVIFLGIGVAVVGVAGGATWAMVRIGREMPTWLKYVMGLAMFAAAGSAGVFGGMAAWQAVFNSAALRPYESLVMYRLPFFEMTEQQFYGWWPMRLILILFVLNMVWATIRRIEFKFVNIGVLTVHTGIVLIAVGSIIYSHFKIEGDTILFRDDLGGSYQNVYYDAVTPAIYVKSQGRQAMVPLRNLPRYNDYPLGSLNLRVDRKPAFAKTFENTKTGRRLRVSIPGFLAYAKLKPEWRTAAKANPLLPDKAGPTPMIRLDIGDPNKSSGRQLAKLLADIPARRAIDTPGWGIEYLIAPSKRRIKDLLSPYVGPHALVVALPGQKFRHVYPVKPGKTIKVGDTGYTINIEKLGAYPMPFITPGYKGAKDQRAQVHITGHGKDFTRIVMARYPERSQDFVKPAGDASSRQSMGPMGQRKDPDPAIHLAYLDDTKPQFHLIGKTATTKNLRIIARLPGGDPLDAVLTEHRFPLGNLNGKKIWLYIADQQPEMVQQMMPQITPKLDRQPKQEGTFSPSLMPVLLQVTKPRQPDVKRADGGAHDAVVTKASFANVFNKGVADANFLTDERSKKAQARVTWQRLVWLPHMKYPKFPDETHKPMDVDVPGIGKVQLTFSRQRHALPFVMKLQKFDMTPIPGSDIPQDFSSTVKIVNLNPAGRLVGKPHVLQTHLNSPIYFAAQYAPLGLRKVKISQSGWDPGDKSDPNRNHKDAQGNFTNKERFSILMIGNNVAIHVVALGAILMALGIPWAFYIKPVLVQRKKRKIQEQLAKNGPPPTAARKSPKPNLNTAPA